MPSSRAAVASVTQRLPQADTNQNGVIEYDEYVPVMVEIIEGRDSKRQVMTRPRYAKPGDDLATLQ